MDFEELKGVVEGLLYLADEPISVESVCEILNVKPHEMKNIFLELEKKYSGKSGILLKKVAGGYFFKSNPQYIEYFKNFLKSLPQMKLSTAALETLAIIAYRQPITVPEILKIRGVKSTVAIKTLLEKKLIVPRGRKKVVGRPMMYGTSKEFLIHFGLNSLDDLPEEKEIKDLFHLDVEDRKKEEDLEVKTSENYS